jgi:creatinine amidohydrolase
MSGQETPLELANVSWHEAERMLQEARLVILPLGSTEQHGPHLPMYTDAILAHAIAVEVARRVNAVVLPTLPYGQVWSARDFPGTMSLTPNTFKAIVKDICHSLHRHGVKTVLLLSGHKGNVAPMKVAARELREEIPVKVLTLSYPKLHEIARGVAETEPWHGGTIHAGEIETSLVLAVEPGLCQMDKAIVDYPPVPPDYDYTPVPWPEFTQTGVFGDARVATAEKGRELLERVVTTIVEILNNIVPD